MKRILLLAVATVLAVVGLTSQAEIISKKAIPDMNAKDTGSLIMTIYCLFNK
ncbi:MAG: hypothetical protein ACP5I4_02295 [Oceanipulchritudo sp.]